MHTISLRGAWTVDAAGVATRRFHAPTGLGPADRVWLVWDGPVATAELNGEPLPAEGERHDVTAALRPTNVLVLAGAGASVCDSVRLEIEAE